MSKVRAVDVRIVQVLYKNVVRVKINMRRNLPEKMVQKMDGWGLFHIF